MTRNTLSPVTYARFGHACNSSSTHSVVWMKRAEDGIVVGPTYYASPPEYAEYGWSCFTLNDGYDKVRYLMAQVAESVRGKYYQKYRDANQPWDRNEDGQPTAAEKAVQSVLKGIWGSDPAYDPESAYSVDHESQDYPPIWRWDPLVDGPGSMVEFYRDFSAWLRQAPVAVLGGNDNGGDHPDAEDFDVVSWWYILRGMETMRRGVKAGTWVGYCRRTGTKIHLDFRIPSAREAVLGDARTKVQSIVEVDFPELVDIKVTDYCTFGCSFCYMGSTKRGQHASLERITEIAGALEQLGTFEVALGGGEPTSHPQFLEIRRAFKDRGITCNFTTKDTKYLLAHWSEVRALSGAVAVSVTNLAEVVKYGEVLSHAQEVDRHVSAPGGFQLVAQVVIGAYSEAETRAILSEIRRALDSIRKKNRYGFLGGVTLLGFKHTGRGALAEEHKVDWVEIVRDLNFDRVGIDTVLAAGVKPEDGINPKFYHAFEGAVSMYIDAVNGTAGPSSFAETFEPLGDSINADAINTAFLSYTKPW